MKARLVATSLAVIASCISVNRSEADDFVVEVESLELSNAEVRELETASGKVVAFDVEGAEARGEVELDRGVYKVYLDMFAPDGDQDAVYVSVGGTRKRVYPARHATLTESGSFSLTVPAKKKYSLAITFGEPGVLLDRLVIRSLPGRAVAEPAEERSRRAETVEALADVEPGAMDDRPRVIVTSDGEIDDECSMVRFLLYANEWDIEAIISSSSQYHSHGHNWAGDDWLDPYLDAYAAIYPAFLHSIPVGLRSVESPDWGGWGGRYVRVRENTWLDPVLEPGYKYPGERWYTSNAWGRSRMREKIPNDKELAAYLKPMWRWFDAIQNDFAARADWCIKPYDQANHPPMVKLTHALDLKVRPGQKVSLSAKGTRDPDGDALTYRWWQYHEADTYEGAIRIVNAGKEEASFKVPGDGGKGKTIHLICEVRDNGTPPLTRYRRVVVEIR